jgi:hypothetical protein
MKFKNYIKQKGGGIFMSVIFVLFTILIVFVVYYLIMRNKEIRYKKEKNEEIYPDEDYMKNVGSKCPDYWTYLGKENGENVCQNTFGIPMDDNNICKYNSSDKICPEKNCKNFSNINWKINKNGFLKNQIPKKNCDWITNCGIDSNSNASWTHIENQCT